MSRPLSPSLRDSLIGFAISEIIVARIAVRARRGIAVLRFGEAVSSVSVRSLLHGSNHAAEEFADGRKAFGDLRNV